MTLRDRLVISAYTGYLMCNFDQLHKFAEEIIGRPILSHEFGLDETWNKLHDAVKEDFLKLCSDKDDDKKADGYSIDIEVYDEIEEYENCTVQVLKNSVTGKYSVGWYRNE